MVEQKKAVRLHNNKGCVKSVWETLCCCFYYEKRRTFNVFGKFGKQYKEIYHVLELLVASMNKENVNHLRKLKVYLPLEIGFLRQDLTFFLPQLT